MNFNKYRLKITFFVLVVIFSMVFATGLLFFSYYFYNKKYSYDSILSQASKNLEKLKINKFQNVIEKINNTSILDFIDENTDKKIGKIISNNFGINYINIYENENLIYGNYDLKLCDSRFVCKKIKKKNYTIYMAVKKNLVDVSSFVYTFLILSIFISILFFPLVYFMVYRITQPMYKNIEFMENFINNAGHEIKTPIANISLSSQILQQKGVYDKEIVQDIVKEANNISQLVDTLLELSKISKFNLNKEKINLKEELLKILKEFNLGDYKLVLKLEDVEKNIDKNHFYILVKNLLSNAIKYNTHKEIYIFLNEKSLSIGNTGNEIKLQDKKKVFDLFYRIDKIKTGYGIGLTIVKKILDINHRKIKISYKKGINYFIVYF